MFNPVTKPGTTVYQKRVICNCNRFQFLSHVKNVRYGTFDWAYPVSCCKDDAEQMETQRDKAVVPVKVCLLDAYR
jgi:hypothetical protein